MSEIPPHFCTIAEAAKHRKKLSKKEFKKIEKWIGIFDDV